MDYRVYHLSRKEVCRSIALAGLLTVAIAYLFYASWLGIVFFPVFIWFFMKRQKKAGREQMQHIDGALAGGGQLQQLDAGKP